MKLLDETSKQVFQYIEDYVAEEGIAPTLREIGEGCFVGYSTVYRYLDRLEAWGWILREPRRARSIRITKYDQYDQTE